MVEQNVQNGEQKNSEHGASSGIDVPSSMVERAFRVIDLARALKMKIGRRVHRSPPAVVVAGVPLHGARAPA